MTYSQTVQYLFDSAPMFQNVGAAAYKEGLGGILTLDEHTGHPHRLYRTIHVGGTNGKGSVSHTLAAILQAQGYRVGLFTSPHLVDFRERIRVNGEMIDEQRVIDFVVEFKNKKEENPDWAFSFFELTTALAFQYFAEQKVDYAVIEVGLGGRLDCTNIISPILSVITNISFDHVQFLGDTLPKIASEKAGIIKPGIPVVVGEAGEQDVRAVFENKAKEVNSKILFAEDAEAASSTFSSRKIERALQGLCQEKNQQTILSSVRMLREVGVEISDEAIKRGFAEVTTMTGLMGRWQTLSKEPLAICDTAHNKGGLEYIFRHLMSLPHRRLHLVIGMVNDKDVDSVLAMMPKDATYYITQASVQRAMPAEELAKRAATFDLQTTIYNNVCDAYTTAQSKASVEDIIYVGGSTFVVADLLAFLRTQD